MANRSKFGGTWGILFAADLSTEAEACRLLDAIAGDIDAIKIGNSLLYTVGAPLIGRLKQRYALPIVADLKLADVSHIASRVVQIFMSQQVDVVVAAGICGPTVLQDVVTTADGACEIWAFTEFTNDSGLIDPSLADRSIQAAQSVGVCGFQVPGTRPHRIEDVRDDVGEDVAIVACGIGIQGGRFGGAIRRGANLEIIGRAIYESRSPKALAQEARRAIQNEGNHLQLLEARLL